MMYDHYVSIHGYGIGPPSSAHRRSPHHRPLLAAFHEGGIYLGWFSFLMVLPLINLIVLYVLAFSDWPALRNEHTAIT